MEFKIERAVRSKAKARVALCGPSGSGKTTSALLLAKGIVEYMLEKGVITGALRGKVGVIDTERRSASLYAHLYDYDVINLEPPYTPDRYLGALHAFERAGFAVIIIDQLSHVWAGMGGLLEQVDQMRGNSNNQISVWKDISPVYTHFIETILASPAHVIANMRAKTHYVMEEYTDRNGNRKTRPVKIGLAPVMRAGIEYEFTSVMDLSTEGNIATSSKDRTSLFQGKTVRLDAEWGKKLCHWLLEGQEADAARDTTTPLQRAQAVCGAGQRACERAKNKPDLEREYVTYREQLLAMKGQVPDDELKELILSLRDTSVQRAAYLKSLTEGAPPPEDAISLDDAVALEDWVASSALPREEFLKNFELPRFSHLPAGRLQAACEWVDKRLTVMGEATPPLPKSLAGRVTITKAKGVMDDLEDDIPF